VEVPVRPDARRAARVARTLDRALWMRLEVGGGEVTGVLAGVRRRRPVLVEVDGSTALGLMSTGVPTVVRATGAVE
jgi:hypothetical protein